MAQRGARSTGVGRVKDRTASCGQLPASFGWRYVKARAGQESSAAFSLL